MNVLNAAGYSFCRLEDPESRRALVRDLAAAFHLRGTVLLTPEGINCGVAGTPDDVRAFTLRLPELLEVEPFAFKFSYSESVPFDRMLVKVKPRLLPVDEVEWDETISATTQLPAATLRDWIEEGRNLVLIDTRNDYEFELGSFEGAIPLPITTFRAFEAEARARLLEWKNKTVVTFCTGGIRCEMAVPLMIKRLGYQNVFQLQGGILEYFQDVGAKHWRGSCFVFDKRVSVDADLRPVTRALCSECAAVDATESADSKEPCRYCAFAKGYQGHVLSG